MLGLFAILGAVCLSGGFGIAVGLGTNGRHVIGADKSLV
jgi:hypothetical protein